MSGETFTTHFPIEKIKALGLDLERRDPKSCTLVDNPLRKRNEIREAALLYYPKNRV